MTLSSAAEIEEVTGQAGAVDQITRFRVHVWRASGKLAPDAFPDGVWRDAEDDHARHWRMRDGDSLIAAIRLTCYPRLDDVPDARALRAHGLDIDGPIGLPERLVVCPRTRRQGLARDMADLMVRVGRDQRLRYLISEASAPTVDMLLRRGRQPIGPAPPDPRFPDLHFTWILTSLTNPGIAGG